MPLSLQYSVLIIALLFIYYISPTDRPALAYGQGDTGKVPFKNPDSEGPTRKFEPPLHVGHLSKTLDAIDPAGFPVEAPSDSGMNEGEREAELLALPVIKERNTAVAVNSGQVSLLEKMGPLVVQEDGQVQRITNWEKMTPEEKRNTERIITKRNRARLEKLRVVNGVELDIPQMHGKSEL